MGVKSNRPNGVSPASCSAPLIRRFGGVPIMVVSPPNRLPYASGIRSREAGIRVRLAISMTTGNISAATPMLFMNAESTPAVSMTTTIMRPSRLPASPSTVRPMTLAMPVRVRPSLRMNIAQTAMTAAFENPATASSGVTNWVRTSAPNTMSAIRSIRILSLTNSTSEITRMVRTSPISNVKVYSPAGSRPPGRASVGERKTPDEPEF